jgi:hypothetical protein
MNEQDAKCQNLSSEDFVQMYWGGNTMLNIGEGQELSLGIHDPRRARQPLLH